MAEREGDQSLPLSPLHQSPKHLQIKLVRRGHTPGQGQGS